MKVNYSETRIWWLWLLATTLGSCIATVLIFQTLFGSLFASNDNILSFAIAGTISMAALGVLQAFILLWFVKNTWWWMLSTLAGWFTFFLLTNVGVLPLPFLLIIKTGARSIEPVIRVVLGDFISLGTFGFTLGLFQWLTLRGKVWDASWWIPINTIGFAVGLLTVGPILAFMTASAQPGDNLLIRYAEIGIIPGLVIGGITGLGLVWLLRRRNEPVTVEVLA